MPSVIIKKSTRVSDGAGGKVETPVVVGTYQASHHLHQARNSRFIRDETSTGQGQGPGVQTNTGGYFNFSKPWPTDLQPNYTLTDADGKVWNVLFVRPYRFTFQVDVEILQ